MQVFLRMKNCVLAGTQDVSGAWERWVWGGRVVAAVCASC